jgi:hypothetical protein
VKDDFWKMKKRISKGERDEIFYGMKQIRHSSHSITWLPLAPEV